MQNFSSIIEVNDLTNYKLFAREGFSEIISNLLFFFFTLRDSNSNLVFKSHLPNHSARVFIFGTSDSPADNAKGYLLCPAGKCAVGCRLDQEV